MTSAIPSIDVPPPSDDAVTACRRELKFVFHGGDERRLCELLELRCRPVRFGAGDESLVHSIYFDDASLNSCAESLAGIPNRTKLRLRWYDEPLARRSTVHFEVKRRSGLTVRKLRTPIRLSRSMDESDYATLLSEISTALPAPQAAALALRGRPSALVSYRRRHYRDPRTGTRLTVDYDVVAYDQLGKSRPIRRFPVPVHDLVVLEAKVTPGDESAAARLLTGMQARLTRSSKYVASCARMGWCALPDRHE